MTMLRWFTNQKQRVSPAASSAIPVDNSGAELEFLRGQADFDAEEMSSVRRIEPLLPALESEYDYDDEPMARSTDPGMTQPAIRFSESLISRNWPDVTANAATSEAGPGQLVLAVIIERHSALLTVRESALIGREDSDEGIVPEVDLSDDDAVSRRHARIYRQGGQYFIRELGSTNGTCLNGEWVVPGRDEPLKTGDIILLGEVSELQVLTVSFGTELTDEDRAIGDLLNQALGQTPDDDGSDWPIASPSSRGGAPADLLDIALSRGVEAGLLEGESDWEYPAARPQWRLREFDGLELPSLVEPYR